MNLLEQYAEYQQIGCADLKECAVAHRCVTELRAKHSAVRCLFDDELQRLYVIVHPDGGDGVPQLYVPLPTSVDIDMIEMERVQLRLGELHAGVQSISLALLDASGTTIYYRLTRTVKEKPAPSPAAATDVQ